MLKKLILTLVLSLGINGTSSAGPVAATVCGFACAAVMECGCVSIGFILTPIMSPPAAAMIAASCGVLQTTGSIPACVTACLALPTP